MTLRIRLATLFLLAPLMPCIYSDANFSSLNEEFAEETDEEGIEDPLECECDFETLRFLRNKFSIGPEIYHLSRTREGGTKQSGWMYGVRASYDHIKRYKFYWGIEALYAKGTLKGHAGGDSKIKSSFTDQNIEGRLGYTFQAKDGLRPSFTPFVGYGYLKDINKFRDPSPVKLKFVTTYRYASYGFLSSITPFCNLSLGLNFKGWSPIHARVHVQDDPDFEDTSMLMGERFNYRVELPVYYRYSISDIGLEVGLVPFYELRHYGKRENYPFDYFDTKFRLWGFNIQLTYRI